jgi:hypothetical protein
MRVQSCPVDVSQLERGRARREGGALSYTQSPRRHICLIRGGRGCVVTGEGGERAEEQDAIGSNSATPASAVALPWI